MAPIKKPLPNPKDELNPLDDVMLERADLATRWRCSEKSVLRAEQRLGLRPCRFLRGVRYRLSDVLRVEEQGFTRIPKKWVGLRPYQKEQLARAEREEASQQSSIPIPRRAPVKQEAGR
jgi:hypothetical protein